MLYNIKKYISLFLSKLRWMGVLHPFWFVLGPRDWKLDGADYESIRDAVQPGDIVITRVDGFVSTWFLPGWWNHTGVCTLGGYSTYYGPRGVRIVHSTAQGVHESYLYDFMRADHIILLKPSTRKIGRDGELLASGYGKAAAEYDFDFDFTDSGKFSCTELAAACYPDYIKARVGLFGRKILIADDIVALAQGDDGPFYIHTEIRK